MGTQVRSSGPINNFFSETAQYRTSRQQGDTDPLCINGLFTEADVLKRNKISALKFQLNPLANLKLENQIKHMKMFLHDNKSFGTLP